jgi:hypothetical protein
VISLLWVRPRRVLPLGHYRHLAMARTRSKRLERTLLGVPEIDRWTRRDLRFAHMARPLLRLSLGVPARVIYVGLAYLRPKKVRGTSADGFQKIWESGFFEEVSNYYRPQGSETLILQ